MAISVQSGFQIGNIDPIDARFTVADQAGRLGFATDNVYDGLIVYQEDTSKLYILTNSAQPGLDASWELVGDQSFPYTGSAQFTGSLGLTGSLSVSGSGNVDFSNVTNGVTGSFSGSFAGDGSGLTGVAPTAGDGIFVNGTTVSVDSGSLAEDMAGDFLIASNGTLNLSSSVGDLSATGFTGSFTGSFTGDGSNLTGLGSPFEISDGTNTSDIGFGGTLIITGSNGGGVLASENAGTVTLKLDSDLSVTDLTVGGDLTVIGTASFQNTENLDVADRFIRMASGSTTAGDGGIVIQQQDASPFNGEAFAFDSDTSRWGLTGSFDASTSTFEPDAFMSAVVVGQGSQQTGSVDTKYTKAGNMFVSASGEIYIYS